LYKSLLPEFLVANEEITFVCPIMRSQILDKIYPEVVKLEITPPPFNLPIISSQESAYALIKHTACFLDRRHISSLSNFKKHHKREVDPFALKLQQYFDEAPLRPREPEYQNQFSIVFNSGVLHCSECSSFREYKIVESAGNFVYNFLDLVIRFSSNSTTWGVMELVCFSTAQDCTQHWEKLGGRYKDLYGSAGQLILLIIDDYDESDIPVQILQQDDTILTIWMRHDPLYSNVRFNSSLDKGQKTEEFDIGILHT
jgi:hypothetical protein